MSGSAAATGALAPHPRGAGVDAEQVARFAKLAAGETPWRHVYTPREAAHLAAQPQSAEAFCRAFCLKEALCKALGEPYSFPQCECLYREGDAAREIVLAPELAERHQLARVGVRFDERFLAGRGECLVVVRVERGSPAPGAPLVTALAAGDAAGWGAERLETLAVADVEARRAAIEAEHFSATELADLGRRRVQSLAGFLALKRALAALAAVPGGAPPPLRDFELGHRASGAPRLVAAPAGFPAAAALVSIAHTRAFAYALAGLPPGAAVIRSPQW